MALRVKFIHQRNGGISKARNKGFILPRTIDSMNLENRVENLRYNYVFMNISEDFVMPSYIPLSKLEGVDVESHAFKSNKILQKLFICHWSQKLNSIVHLPLKRIWFKRMCKRQFQNDKPVCYVFYGGKYITEDSKLYNYIKFLNPLNKCVIYYADLISKKGWDLDNARKVSDYIISYDKGEAEKYQIAYYDEMAYDILMDITEPTAFDYDVYFLGYAKDRLKQIYDVYFKLESAGVRCHFVVCGVSPTDRVKAKGIHYSAPIGYKKNIENVIKSKCVLELIQGGSSSNTLRFLEAQRYHRLLLTDNVYLNSKSYYNPEIMQVFEKADGINVDFINRAIDYSQYDDSQFDPFNRITYLENLIDAERSK